jgi:membrane protein required for colicin V production
VALVTGWEGGMTFARVFDIGAAFALAFFVVRGAMRGLTGEIVSLLGLIASVVCGWTFASPMSEEVLHYFPTWSPTITELACAVVIFMGVSLAFAVVGKTMKALVKAAKLSFLDHVMGAAAGGARTFCILLFIYGVVSTSPFIPGDWMEDSVAMKGASVAWPSVFNVMTENGWIDPSRFTPVLPDYLNAKPAPDHT